MQGKSNEKIRKTLKEKKVYQWQLAESLGISEYTLTRMLRHELSEEDSKRICESITEIAERR